MKRLRGASQKDINFMKDLVAETERFKPQSVETCIRYILSCGFSLISRKNWTYTFKRGDTTLSFSLNELRDAYMNGF